MVYDNGGEFVGSEFQELLQLYHIKAVPTTMQNPQANGCLERMHLTLADKLRMMEVEVEEDCPIEINRAINTMLQAAAWGLRTTISTVSKTSPGGAVFGRDMVFNFKMRADWENIARSREKLAAIGNNRENEKRKEHKYKEGDKVLIVKKRYERSAKIDSAPTEGPFVIARVHCNGTVNIKRNNYYEMISIMRIKPFHENDEASKLNHRGECLVENTN